jgi:hypothetical protein
VAAVAVVFALALGSVRAQAASDTREIKAREDFAAGRFQEALDIFARLYAVAAPHLPAQHRPLLPGPAESRPRHRDVPRLPAQGQGDHARREERDRRLHQ